VSAETVSQKRVDEMRERLHREAEKARYHLNPDHEFTDALVEGLLRNQERYGYPSCPCRLSEGTREQDLDIICPCDYRDPDLLEWGACYCALYVSEDVVRGEREAGSIPERRPPAEERPDPIAAPTDDGVSVWRCRVCGYLCAREHPPERCPICGAEHDRFEPLPFTVR
jgi:ferredoxin-thioredoxin reductase catalytic subunit/rubredoxin